MTDEKDLTEWLQQARAWLAANDTSSKDYGFIAGAVYAAELAGADDYQAIRDAGFESPGELLAAWQLLTRRYNYLIENCDIKLPDGIMLESTWDIDSRIGCGDGCKDRGSCRVEDESPKAAPAEQEAGAKIGETETLYHWLGPDGVYDAPLGGRRQPDPAEALAKMLQRFVDAGKDIGKGIDTDICDALLNEAAAVLLAYRASKKGGGA